MIYDEYTEYAMTQPVENDDIWTILHKKLWGVEVSMGSVHTLIKNSSFLQHTMLVIGIGIAIAFAAPTVLLLIKCAWSQNCIGTKKLYKSKTVSKMYFGLYSTFKTNENSLAFQFILLWN